MLEDGKNFTASAPASIAATTSVAVPVPGITGMS